jgi:hypothetical protein
VTFYQHKAKKRADIDRRLQAQLAEENDNVRRTEELKRDRQTANRKEEELKLRETIVSASPLLDLYSDPHIKQ